MLTAYFGAGIMRVGIFTLVNLKCTFRGFKLNMVKLYEIYVTLPTFATETTCMDLTIVRRFAR